jgi:hypothetical protein
MGHGQRHEVARCGGGGSAAVGRGGVATTLAGGARATSSITGVSGADWWAPATVSGGGSLNTIQIQMNSNYFKTFQILTDLKVAFSSPKNLK